MHKILATAAIAIASLSTLLSTAPLAQAEQAIVEIGDQQILHKDFLAYLSLLHPGIDFAALPETEQRRHLDEFVERKLFATRARAEALDKTPATRTRVEFFTDGILAEAMRGRLLADIEVSERELNRYYREHREEFREPPRVLIEHLIYSQPTSAANARAKLLAGAAWDALVAEEGRDPNLVYFRRGWLTPPLLIQEIREPVLALGPDEVTAVLVSGYGHHVIELQEREAARYRSVEEARAEIVGKVRRAKAAALHTEVIAEMKRQQDVRIHFDRIRSQPESAATHQ